MDRRYYDESGYFEEGAEHLLDPGSHFQRYRTGWILRLARPRTGWEVVDLGCGWGTVSFALAERNVRVVGVDFSRRALRLCLRRLEKEPRPHLQFVRADAGNTGLRGGRWDLVVAADLIEHLTPGDTLRVYREARRLLRPGGRLVIWAPSPEHLLERLRVRGLLAPDPTHVDYKTLERVVRELRSEGFEIESARHAPSHLPALRTLERWAARWVPLLRRRVAVVARWPGGDGREAGSA